MTKQAKSINFSKKTVLKSLKPLAIYKKQKRSNGSSFSHINSFVTCHFYNIVTKQRKKLKNWEMYKDQQKKARRIKAKKPSLKS